MGIIGKPEESKAALMDCILRFHDFSGIVRIDGVNIADVGLQHLRENLSVIPQVVKNTYHISKQLPNVKYYFFRIHVSSVEAFDEISIQ